MKLFFIALAVLLFAEATIALWASADIRVRLAHKRSTMDPELEDETLDNEREIYTPDKKALEGDLTTKIKELLTAEKIKYGLE